MLLARANELLTSVYALCVCGPAHPFVMLAGHVGPEDALHGESSGLLALEPRPLRVHALVLLNDDG